MIITRMMCFCLCCCCCCCFKVPYPPASLGVYPADALHCPKVPIQIFHPGMESGGTRGAVPGRCPVGAGRVAQAGPGAPPPPPRAPGGEDAGGRRERARPRDGRYKSAGGRRSAPAAPPLGLRSLPALGFSQPPTCGCGGRPSPGSTMAGTRRAARRPRTFGSSPRAAPPPPLCSTPLSPGRVPGRTGTAAKLRAGGRRAWRFLRQRRPCRAPTATAPGSRGAAVGAARRSGAPADAPASASVSSPFLPLAPRRAGRRAERLRGATWGWGAGSPATSLEPGGAAASRSRPRPREAAEQRLRGRDAGGRGPAPQPPARALAVTPSLFLGLWGRVSGSGPGAEGGRRPTCCRVSGLRGESAPGPTRASEVPGPSRVVEAESRGYYSR